MATPIKITKPISGIQSRIFNEQLDKSSVNRVRPEKKEQMLALVAKILSKKILNNSLCCFQILNF